MDGHGKTSKKMLLSIPILVFVQALFKFHQFESKSFQKSFQNGFESSPNRYQSVPKSMRNAEEALKSAQGVPNWWPKLPKKRFLPNLGSSLASKTFQNRGQVAKKSMFKSKSVLIGFFRRSCCVLETFSEGFLMQNYAATTKMTHYRSP